MKKENEVLKEVLEYLELKKIFHFRCNNIAAPGRSFRGLRGVPDIVCILEGGLFLGVECKSSTGKQSEYQKSFEENVSSLGGLYTVSRAASDIADYLEGL